MTMFVKMYHPQLGNRQVEVPLQSVDDRAARGWLLVDGSTPAPSSPYLTPTVADSRYLRADDVDDPATPSGLALRAAAVAAVVESADVRGVIDAAIAEDAPAIVVDVLADDPSVVQAAADAVDGALADAGVLHGPAIPAGMADDLAFTVTDSEGRRSWLEIGVDGGPSSYAKQIIKTLVGVADTDPYSGLAYALVDSQGKLAELTVGDDGRFPTWVAEALTKRGQGALDLTALQAALTALQAAQGVIYRSVKLDGTGDYVSIKAANDAITDASASKQYVIWVHPGEYDHTATPDVIPKAFIKYIGVDEHLVRVTLFQPDNADNATIINNSPFRFQGDAWLENMTIEVRNGRYCIHDESANVVKDWTHYCKRVRMIHHGNGGARAWRDANPGTYGPGTSVSTTASAYGYGASSGGTAILEDCLMVSETSPWGVHNNNDFTRPNKNILRRCRLVCTDDRFGAGPQLFNLTSLGSTTPDEVILEGCEFDGVYIGEIDAPWAKVTGKQPANHSEYRLSMAGCSTIGFTTTARGLALMAQSASSGASSRVRFSGTAAAVLIGQQRYRDGGGGLRGYAYGELDMSGILGGLAGTTAIPANTLAERLGNRTGAPITLTVTVDGGAPVDVVFGADHSAQSDATILGLINTALGSAATAALYNVSQGETYPQVLDKQRTVKNRTTTGIPRWAAVVYETATGSAPTSTKMWARKMTAADPVSALIGVALEPIPPGGTGRILTEGIFTAQQLHGDNTTGAIGSGSGVLGGTAFTAGTALYASDTLDGGFTLTAGTGRKVGEAIYAPTNGGAFFHIKAQGAR